MNPHWKRAPAVAVLLLAVGISGPARAAAAADPAVDPARTVTLITGDRVTLLGNGSLSIRPGAGRSGVPMMTSSADGHTTVLPADVLPLLRSDRLDRRLFDVTGLLAARYDDRRADLPLIVAGAQPTGAVTRKLPSIRATAIHIPKSDLRTRWKDLAAGGKVWLDAVGHYTGAEGVQQIGAPVAWRAGLTGAGVTVGVIDSGVDVTHPDLAAVVAVQRDFSAESDGGDVRDLLGHGTHVASILAGSGAGSAGRYRGVAPGVRLVSAKVGDFTATESSVIAAMDWISGTENAAVVNMSIGFPDSPGTDPMEAAVADLTRRDGTLFVVGAGNDGNDGITSPGSAPEALTVGAVDHDDALADFSGRGPAPGDLIKPDVTAPGVDVTGALSHDAGGSGTDLYDTGWGTSYAAPHATGAAAILAQRHPDWTAAMLRAALTGTARRAPGVGVFAQGAGRIDIPAALETTLLADPSVLSLDTQKQPHDGNVATRRKVTYRNTSPTPLTLKLRLDISGPDGRPASLVTLSPATLTVPAGGSAQAEVTVAPSSSAPDGAYSGQIVATAGAATVHTPVGLIRQAETHALTVHQIDRTGAETSSYYTEIIGIDTQFRWGSLTLTTDPTYTLRVPRGRYAIVSRIFGDEGGVHTGTVLVNPNLTVDGDTDLALDARAGKPVQVVVPEPGAVRAITAVDIGVGTLSGWASEGTLLSGQFQQYTAQIGTADGGFVSTIRTAFDDGSNPSGYAYQLGWVFADRLPTGFSRTVTASQVSRETMQTFRQVPSSAVELGATLVTPGYPLVTAATRTALAREVRYYTDGASQWVPQVLEYADEGPYFDEVLTEGTPTTYRPGQASVSRWNAPVIGPCLAPGWGVTWADDELRVRVPMACDGAGHVTTVDPAIGSTTLFRNGVQEATSEAPGRAMFPVAPADGTYLLRAETTRSEPFETSTRSTVDWTFTDPEVLLSLFTVRMAPDLDGPAPTGKFTVPMFTSTRVTAVALQVSYDDGKTWQPAAVRQVGSGAYSADLVHPAGGGYASLRVSATGGGSTVTQTVIRAYRIGQ